MAIESVRAETELRPFHYAGFWPRLGSLLLDMVILSPLAAITIWGNHHYRLSDVYAVVPQVLFGLWFSVYLVGRFGGTPGKLILGLRVVKVSGEPATFSVAFIRDLPGLVLDTLWRVGLVMTLLHMTDTEYFAIGPHKHYSAIEKMAPPWCHWVEIALQVWVWSELIVLLTNKKRRAIHDFIAGTVVIRKAASNALQPPLQPLAQSDGG